jgi:hypothetical protein
MKNFRIVDIPGRNSDGLIVIDINYKDGKLSISGSTNHASGQIYDCLKITQYQEGWDKTKVDRLVEIWKRWHLNHMRAGCEHQQEQEWNKRPIDPSLPLNKYGKHFEGQNPIHGTCWSGYIEQSTAKVYWLIPVMYVDTSMERLG